MANIEYFYVTKAFEQMVSLIQKLLIKWFGLVWFGIVNNAKSIFIHINSSISNNSLCFFVYTQLNAKTILFQTIPNVFCLHTVKCKICTISNNSA